MADNTKIQAAYDALIEGFVLPLVEGAPGALGRPIAPGCFPFFRETRTSSPAVDERIFDALHRAATDVAPVDKIPWPSPGIVAMAAAAHDLLAVTDPSLDRVLARGARATMLSWVDRWIDLVPAPATRGEALARHGLIEPLLRSRRKDVVVKNWAYTYRFHGREVPWNVVAFPRLRFVRQEERLVSLVELLSAIDEREHLGLAERLAMLVSRSPVTELLHVAERPTFRFGLASLAVISDPAIVGGIAKALVAQGEWPAARVIGAALGAPLLRREPALLGVALRLPIEMIVTSAVDANGKPSDLPEVLDEGSMRYAGLLVALLSNDRALEELRILDDEDRAALQRRAERFRRVVSKEAARDARVLIEIASRAAGST